MTATRRTRVVFAAHAFPRHQGDLTGGFLLRLAEALEREGVDVQAVAPAAPGLPARDRLRGVAVRRYRYAPRRAETLAYTGGMHLRAASPTGALALAGLLAAGALALRRAAAGRREAAAGHDPARHRRPAGPNAAGGASRLRTGAARLRRDHHRVDLAPRRGRRLRAGPRRPHPHRSHACGRGAVLPGRRTPDRAAVRRSPGQPEGSGGRAARARRPSRARRPTAAAAGGERAARAGPAPARQGTGGRRPPALGERPHPARAGRPLPPRRRPAGARQPRRPRPGCRRGPALRRARDRRRLRRAHLRHPLRRSRRSPREAPTEGSRRLTASSAPDRQAPGLRAGGGASGRARLGAIGSADVPRPGTTRSTEHDMNEHADHGTGKVTSTVFSDVILGHLGARDADVLVGPRHGVDVGVLRVAPGVAMALTTDPVFVVPGYGWERAAWFAVHILASDAATSGLALRWMSVDLNLPTDVTEADLAALWEAYSRACADLGLAVVTGHTARYDGCNWPMVGGATCAAIGPENAFVTPTMAQPGDRVIVTKGAAIEATALFAATFPDRLAKGVGEEVTAAADRLFEQMTVVPEARVAASYGLRERGVT